MKRSPRECSPEELSQRYDSLYAEADALLKKHNPCKWENGDCAAKSHGCCQGCEHLGPQGCTVQALACKLWLCYNVKTEANRQVIIGLNELRVKGEALGLNTHPYGPGFRASKEESLK